MSRILIVDDEESILKALRRLLAATPCSANGVDYRPAVTICSDPREALEIARHTAFDLVLSDYRMPGMDGVAFLKAFRGIQPDAVRMILSGYADLNGLMGAINEAQITRFISKPWNDYELVSAIGQGLAFFAVQREGRDLADSARARRGDISAEELERRRLEVEDPGITRVKWGPDGSVMLEDFGDEN